MLYSLSVSLVMVRKFIVNPQMIELLQKLTSLGDYQRLRTEYQKYMN